MEFMFATVGMIGLIVLVLVLLARAYPGSGADLVDWRPTRSPELEAQLEIDDVQQMIDAQNEDLTESEVQHWVEEDEAVRRRGRKDYEERVRDLEDELGA